MQTKINLKFPEMQQTTWTRDQMRHSIDQKYKEIVTKEYEKQFDENINREYLKVRNRNISGQSPFSKLYNPP